MLSNYRAGHRNLATLCFIIQFIFSAGSVVKYLPGFDGELPFTLETGYVSVGSAEMFYYFIESEGNPKKDPVLLWYSGGPGCSAFNGLIYQIGPIQFNITGYDAGLPPLSYYPYSWTKSASILFVDAPVGSGFSYSTTQEGWPMSDTKTGYQVYGFLKKWLIDHPQYLKQPLFVGADSYSGLSATMVVKHILDDNGYGQEPRLNLKGYIIGCPKTDSEIQENSKVIYAHRMALISDELYEAAKNSCNSDFYVVDTNSQCYVDLQLVKNCIKDISTNHILEPMCVWASPHRPTQETARRSLRGNPAKIVMSSDPVPQKWCHNFNYSLSYLWANDETVQAALNVRPGTVQDWKRCNESLDYDYDVTSVLDYHRNFTKSGLQALVYNGDHDFIIPNVGTQQWIRELNLTIDIDWRQWLVDGQVAGYTINYSEDGYLLTYATVKGAGHSPQEYKRRECFDMFDRFIHYYPL
ncbi:serine carboxypeptidase-like 18 [Euphorbia lathyris]|uniref:serine carboxypeptidase-like 18 n=1 Tax=Euphorbia lathyris TaxID=212925 RepID=UPI0033140461